MFPNYVTQKRLAVNKLTKSWDYEERQLEHNSGQKTSNRDMPEIRNSQFEESYISEQ